jgi:hypothetical protein
MRSETLAFITLFCSKGLAAGRFTLGAALLLGHRVTI